MFDLRQRLFGTSRKTEYWRLMGAWLIIAFICMFWFSTLPNDPYPAETYLTDEEVFLQRVLTGVIFLSLVIVCIYLGRLIELISYGFKPEEE